MRLRTLAMVGVLLAPVLGAAATAGAGDGNGRGWRKVEVTMTVGGPGPTLVDFFCNPADPAICGVLVKFPEVNVTGDLVGTTIESDASAIAASGVSVVAVSGSFVGTVEKCGTGSFLYSGRGVLDSNLEGTISYQLVPKTGTGDLQGITGTLSTDGSGTISGVLRCRRH